MTIRNLKEVAKSASRYQASVIRSGGVRNGSFMELGLSTPQYRLYSQYAFSSRTSTLSKVSALRNVSPKNFSTFPVANSMAHHAQLAWQNFYWSTFCNRRTLRTINKIAQAVSLAVSRSYVVMPGIFALACGTNVAFARAPTDVDFLQPRNALYMHAQNGHLYIISSILSIFQGIVLLSRACYLMILFFPSIAMAPFADSFGPRFRKFWLQVVHQTLEKAGPAFIKWGQWAASRPDLFPADLCEELSKLHSKAPQHNFAHTKKTIEKAFGRKISDIFEDFEELPVASGSIAQVHRATLKHVYHGRQMKPMLVAVKVRHPGVGESIKRDFDIINIVAKTSKFMPTLKWLRLDESVQQFGVFMMSQVDLAREAAHLSRFIYNFRSWKDVSFPKPVYPLVHPAVLVETFEHGESVSHYVDEIQGQERLKSALAHIGTHALLKMLLVTYFLKSFYPAPFFEF